MFHGVKVGLAECEELYKKRDNLAQRRQAAENYLDRINKMFLFTFSISSLRPRVAYGPAGRN